jgi:type IX secretion system PorP/SprF family membrane protein
MLRPLCFFIVFVFGGKVAWSQDPHFSMFFANPVYLNPAFAGINQGTSVIMNYHEQWPGIPDGDLVSSATSFRTMNASVEYQPDCFLKSCKSKVGFGLSLFQDAAGQAPIQTFGLALAGSYGYRFTDCRSQNFSQLRFGWNFSLMKRNLNYDHLIYSSQLSPYYGLIDDPSSLNISSPVYFNNNVGLLYTGVRNLYENWVIGASASNLFEPNQALVKGEVAYLPRRYTFHAGSTFKIGNAGRVVKLRPVYLTPQARWDTQAEGTLNLLTVGAYLQSSRVYGGVFYQDNIGNYQSSGGNGDPRFNRGIRNLSISGGVDLYQAIKGIDSWSRAGRRLILGLTYDASLTGISNANTLGGIEINLRMTFWGEPTNRCNHLPLDVKKCPVLSQ